MSLSILTQLYSVMWYILSAGSSVGSSYGTSTQRKKPSSTAASSSGRQPMRAVHHHYQSLPGATGYGRSNSSQIRFYNRGEPYYEFTNFYPCTVVIDNKSWPTTEHYFQAQKFVGTPYVEKIRRLPSPRDAFQLSRDPSVSRWRRSDWESVKDDIMLKALRVKFSDSMGLREKLRSTGEKELVEHTTNDSYWGDGGNGLGQNKLGKLLMQVRRELKEKHGPYHLSSYHSTSRDDSSIPLGAVPTHTTPRLRRSNSLSNLSSSRPSYTPTPSTAWPSGGTGRMYGTRNTYSDVTKGLGQTGNKLGVPKQGASRTNPSPVSQRSSHNSYSAKAGNSSNIKGAVKAVGKVAGAAKQGVENVASAVANALPHRSPSSPSRSGGKVLPGKRSHKSNGTQ